MASKGRAPEQGYRQDYIARIRYENNLPPPPGAPKLLNIPIEGLNYYTSAAFASRMARQQPLNIEADAELGMPIDLVGMPGIFDGDESSIQAPLATPPVHPRDKNLLRPVSELGKPKFTSSAHSFLRRTEYISSEAKARAEAHAAKGVPRSPGSKVQRKSTDVNNEDPMNILRHVIKGFDLAYPGDAYSGQDDAKHLKGAQPSSAEMEAWNRPTHPRKPDLELLDSYALKPDLDALPDQGAFIITKFSGAPSTSNNEHDIRMDVGLLNPMERPGEEYDYEFYLPREQQTAKALKRRFVNISDEDDVSDSQEMKDGKPMFKFQHQRTYDMGRQVNSLEQPYREVALALHDPSLDKRRNAGDTNSRLQQGAYYYPIGMKMQLKPKRNKNLANLGLGKLALEEDIERPDEINLMLRDPDEEEMGKRRGHRDELTVEGAGLNGTAQDVV